MLAGDFSDKQRLIIVNLGCLKAGGIFQELSTLSPLVAHFNGQTTTRIDLRPKRCNFSPSDRAWLGSLSSLGQDWTDAPQLTLFSSG